MLSLLGQRLIKVAEGFFFNLYTDAERFFFKDLLIIYRLFCYVPFKTVQNLYISL